jgi:hypothetical protein
MSPTVNLLDLLTHTSGIRDDAPTRRTVGTTRRCGSRNRLLGNRHQRFSPAIRLQRSPMRSRASTSVTTAMSGWVGQASNQAARPGKAGHIATTSSMRSSRAGMLDSGLYLEKPDGMQCSGSPRARSSSLP